MRLTETSETDIERFIAEAGYNAAGTSMPLKIGDKTYRDFGTAVEAVMRRFKWKRPRAQAYVAAIERRQKGAHNAAANLPARSAVRARSRNTAHEHGGTLATQGGARRWREEGDWFIVPARITGAGVMNGAHKPPEEIVRLFDTMPDEVPSTMLHPDRDDLVPRPEEVIGKARKKDLVFDDLRPLIEVERWLDKRTAGGRAVAEANKRGEWLDNSIAYEFDLVPESGEWDGRPYDRVEANIKVLHDAVLPTGTGACSQDQRCGTLTANSADDDESSSENQDRDAVVKKAAAEAAKAAAEAATQQVSRNASDAAAREKAVNDAVQAALKGADMAKLLAVGNECATKAKNAMEELEKFKTLEKERDAKESATLDQALKAVSKNQIGDADLKAMNLEAKRLLAKTLGANAEETVTKLNEVYDKLLKAKNKALTDDELKAMTIREKELVLKAVGVNTAEAMSSLPVGGVLPGKSGNQGAGRDRESKFSMAELHGKKPGSASGQKKEKAESEA